MAKKEQPFKFKVYNPSKRPKPKVIAAAAVTMMPEGPPQSEVERRAQQAMQALKEAIAASRNDEQARALAMENERQAREILLLQAELERMRGESRENVGWDKHRYFAALGRDLSDVSLGILKIGEILSTSDDPAIIKLAHHLEEYGQCIGEFAENATCYAEEAKNHI